MPGRLSNRSTVAESVRHAGAGRRGLKEIIFSRNPGDWIDDQLADIEELRRKTAA